jgi:hypothetical protein
MAASVNMDDAEAHFGRSAASKGAPRRWEGTAKRNKENEEDARALVRPHDPAAQERESAGEGSNAAAVAN